MNLLMDFKLMGKNILVIGGGRESYKKSIKFLEEGCKITVYSKSFTKGFKRLAAEGKISIIKANIDSAEEFLKNLTQKPDLLIAATNNYDLNLELVSIAKKMGCMVYAIDNPSMSDFTFPALAKIGDVKIAISTGGKSPAIARLIRMKIERIIKPEHLLQIQLQHQIRSTLKNLTSNQKMRRKILYSIIKDYKIKELLKFGKIEEARLEAFKIIESYISLREDSHGRISNNKNEKA
ncbi:MAG: bifunctional precorrin-2 dehydrogenase/sirohydrochlorin ferrochelatase [Candidatus Methanomethyliaceae archaeon]|nr:bifunctional precorrin-2 dehydrogenase/sirohydrochlorin ferrochelatase [Candidatus Methanomethyliaceae archaeon]MDW7971356.1 bifunctional precorrin-2 dehydrogenase/sirohydrochlorin ferrochelatase [Nitrososphaerota archaeon]